MVLDQMYSLLEVAQPNRDIRVLTEIAKRAKKTKKRKRHKRRGRFKELGLIAMAVAGMAGTTARYDHTTRAPQSIGAILTKHKAAARYQYAPR